MPLHCMSVMLTHVHVFAAVFEFKTFSTPDMSMVGVGNDEV